MTISYSDADYVPMSGADLLPATSEDEVPIWDDWGIVDALRGETDTRDRVLSSLVRLIETSINGYLELMELSTDPRVILFAELIVRQRAALCRQLRGQIERERRGTDELRDLSDELQASWRSAVWNLEQDRLAQCIEHAERAESLLEMAFLIAAKAFRDGQWVVQLQEFATSVYGAASVWEELGEEISESVGAAGSIRGRCDD